MKKPIKILLSITIILLSQSTIGQNIGINGTGANPNASAMLDIDATDKGLLIPRVALTATNVSTPVSAPAVSLIIYNTATSGSGTTAVSPGFYHWNGTEWEKVITGNTISTTDDQNLTGATLVGTNLQIDIENGSSTSVDLAALQDGTGTDSQTLTLTGNTLAISGGNNVTLTDNVNDADFVIGNEYNTGASLSGTTLSITDGGGAQTVNLSGLQDHDWYKVGGTTQPNAISDNIYTQGSVGIGITTVPQERLEVNGNIIMSGGDRMLESATGFVGIKPNDPTYGLILRDYTGGSSVWTDFRTVNAATDFLHIAVNSTSTSEGLVVSDNGNVGVRTTTPHTSAALELGGIDKGFLINRSDTSNITTPAFGLMTLAPVDSCLYMFNGVSWMGLGGGGCCCEANLTANGVTPPPASFPTGTVFCTGLPTQIVDVTSVTGKIWMDRNLGASQVAISITDAASYGDLYQWGRFSDGHQCRNSSTTTTQANNIAPITGTSWYGKFILSSSSWNTVGTLNWTGVNAVNNPCPTGYRVPSRIELSTESGTWSPQSNVGAFNSVLKLPSHGWKDRTTGTLLAQGTQGMLWQAEPYYGADWLLYRSNLTFGGGGPNSYGAAVRCIKD